MATCTGLITGPLGADVVHRGPFEIHYETGQEETALRTAQVLDDALLVYDRRLPAGEKPIRVHIASSREQFQELAGDVPTRRIQGFADSADGVIVMRAPHLLAGQGNYDAILRHELLHVLLARNTAPGNLPRWLNEGLAMMLSREDIAPRGMAMARLYSSGDLIEYEELAIVFAAPGNELKFGEAYTQSLSMTRHLRKRLGDDRFWVFIRDLRDRPFDEAIVAWTGLTPIEFYEDWRGSLWRTALVASLVTGFSLFQIAAVLLVVGYFRRRRRARNTMDRWDREDEYLHGD